MGSTVSSVNGITRCSKVFELMTPKSNTAPFRPGHETTYGLKICERDAATNEVVSVVCRFCASFGREETVGAKRKVTGNFRYYKRPFRTDHYTKHAKESHPQRWELYRASSDAEKSTFFDEIVDVIIGEMLFCTDDLRENITKELLRRMLA